METNHTSPESLLNLLLSGEAQQIYHAIQYQADLCMEMLQKSEQNKEIDANKAQSLRRQVKDNLEEASTLRFTLNTTDKKIQLEQNTNPILKQITGLLKETGKENNLENLVDCLGDLESGNSTINPSDPLNLIRSLVCESLKNRVEMAWCYDEILEAYRSALVGNMINVAHRLTEVALLLQDSQAIQEVRMMLKSLNLDVPAKMRIPNLQSSPTELKKILKNGIESMHKTLDDIQRLDDQRKEMKKAVKRLNEQMGNDADEPPKPVQPIQKPIEPKKESPGRGMVFPSLRKRNR